MLLKFRDGLLLVLILFTPMLYAETVAIVGKRKISQKEFNKKYAQVRKQAVINPPSKEVFLEDLVRYEIGLQEAKKQKIEISPLVQERINQLLYQSLVEKEIGKKVESIKVTESEMKNYYKKNPELRTSHILIEIKVGANKKQRAAARKRAEEILKEVKRSKRPFEELVALYTDDIATKRSGGDIGWQSRLTIDPKYYDAAMKLKVGKVGNGLVETLYGFHIIKLTGKNPYEKANKRHLRQVVFDIKRKKVFDAYFAKVKGKYSVKTFPKALN